MPGEIEEKWDPYPAKDNAANRLRGIFHGGDAGTAASGTPVPTGTAGVGGGDPYAVYPGRGPTGEGLDQAIAEQRARRGEEIPGGSYARFDLPLATGNQESDPRVQSVQRYLQQAGFDIGPDGDDGYFGPQTMNAFNEFINSYVSPGLRYEVGQEVPPEMLMALHDVVRSVR